MLARCCFAGQVGPKPSPGSYRACRSPAVNPLRGGRKCQSVVVVVVFALVRHARKCVPIREVGKEKAGCEFGHAAAELYEPDQPGQTELRRT